MIAAAFDEVIIYPSIRTLVAEIVRLNHPEAPSGLQNVIVDNVMTFDGVGYTAYDAEALQNFENELKPLLDLWAVRYGDESMDKIFGTEEEPVTIHSYPEPGVSDSLYEFLKRIRESV